MSALHPSVPPRLLPSGSARAPVRRAAAGVLVLLAALGSVALAGPADPPNKPKGSAFAPHHTQSHVYGTPIARPILHQRKKPVKSAAPAPDGPIK